MAEQSPLSRKLFEQLGNPDSQNALIELLIWLSKDDFGRLAVIGFFSAIGEKARQEENEEVVTLFMSLIERMAQSEVINTSILALAFSMALKKLTLENIDA